MPLLLIMLLLFPATYFLIGLLMKKGHSEFPDTTVGFHMGKIAGRNRETWEEANRYSGFLTMRLGIAVLAVNIAAVLLVIGIPLHVSNGACVAYLLCSAVIPLIAMLALTGRHLRKKFGDAEDPDAGSGARPAGRN